MLAKSYKYLILIFVAAISASQCLAVDLSDAELAFKLRDYKKAVAIFRELAKTGDAKAEFALANIFRDGVAVQMNMQESVSWLRRSAEHGYPRAMGLYGSIFESGKLVPKDLKAAIFWIEKAAEGGNAESQNALGWAYMSNYLELKADYKLAMKWNLKSSSQGHGEASSNVGLLYENGWGVPVNYPEAVKWYKMALDQDPVSWQSWYHLAGMYENGLGVEKDLEYAAKLYSHVVESGDAEFSKDAIIRLSYIQDLLKLQEADEIQYPQELPPREGRKLLKTG